MPWHVAKSASCPKSKPWGVIKDSDGTVEGCHATKKAATKQMQALYSQEENSMKPAPERRHVSHDFEVRQNEDGSVTIVGYAAVFNKDSQPLGWDGFIERVAPGAFKRTIGRADIRALFNHEPSVVLGRNKAGTLRLAEDSIGLHYEIDADPDNSDHRNLVRMIQRGDVSQSSFGFSVIKDEWVFPEDKDEPTIRTLKEVRLFDVSPVTFPAYLDTEVDIKRALRSLSQAIEKPFEDLYVHAQKGDLRQFITEEEVPTDPPDPAERPSGLVRAQKRVEILERKYAASA